jgi:hypothetical protein
MVHENNVMKRLVQASGLFRTALGGRLWALVAVGLVAGALGGCAVDDPSATDEANVASHEEVSLGEEVGANGAPAARGVAAVSADRVGHAALGGPLAGAGVVGADVAYGAGPSGSGPNTAGPNGANALGPNAPSDGGSGSNNADPKATSDVTVAPGSDRMDPEPCPWSQKNGSNN